MILADAELCDVATLIAGNEFRIYADSASR